MALQTPVQVSTNSSIARRRRYLERTHYLIERKGLEFSGSQELIDHLQDHALVVFQHLSNTPKASRYDFLDHSLTKSRNARHWSCQICGRELFLISIHGLKLSLALLATHSTNSDTIKTNADWTMVLEELRIRTPVVQFP